MANKLIKNLSYVSRSNSVKGKNSEAVTVGNFVQAVGGIAFNAGTTGQIDGVANHTVTFDSDNETVALEKLSYTVAVPGFTEVEVAISGGTITVADEGKYFSLEDSTTVNGTTEATTALDGQLRMVKFISATKGIFTTIDSDVN